MTSLRRVALSLGLVAACGGALVFSLSKASGAPKKVGAAKTPTPKARKPVKAKAPVIVTVSAPSGTPAPTGTPNPTLKQTIGISPVQTGTQPLIVLGGLGDGNNSYDLQNEVVYSLLRQSGVPIPNVLHPFSTAKPSFVVEHLIVYSLTGGNSNSSAPATPATPVQGAVPGAPGAPGGVGTNAPAAPKPYTDAERTVMAVGRVVDAEISRGSGRIGGAHLQKLRLLRSAISSLEAANRLASGAGATPSAGGRPGAAGGGNSNTSKTDPREYLYGQARLTSRRADRYAPTGL